MKIESVVRKTVIVINGVEHVMAQWDYTECIIEASDEREAQGQSIMTDDHIIAWIESEE